MLKTIAVKKNLKVSVIWDFEVVKASLEECNQQTKVSLLCSSALCMDAVLSDWSIYSYIDAESCSSEVTEVTASRAVSVSVALSKAFLSGTTNHSPSLSRQIYTYIFYYVLHSYSVFLVNIYHAFVVIVT